MLRNSFTRSVQLRLKATVRDLPIRSKLMVIIMATTASALVLAGFGIVAFDAFLLYEHTQHDYAALAGIVASNTTAALAFEDPRAASETLRDLNARAHLIAACIYRLDGSVFASYVRAGARCPQPGAGVSPGLLITRDTASRPMVLDSRRIGTLILLYDLGEIYDRMQILGTTVFIVLLISIAAASLLSRRLRALVATPVTQLAGVATEISKTKDYSLRARKYSADELGVLVGAFNEMLAGIQSRDNELRRALEELQKSNGELARKNEDLERFAFIASHDLQEPLRMIMLYAQMMARQPADLARDQIDRILECANRMRELLADLLAYTEIGAPADQPPGPVDLNQVLEKVLQNLKGAIDDSGAIVESARLPTIQAHPAHFLSLFQNLIGNAIKYRSADSPRVRISVESSNGSHRFSVADNGIGIDPQYHARIFLAFKRLHGQKIPGTGIGLAICQRVVERYGGSIWVDSAAGRGATFVFVIPNAPGARVDCDERHVRSTHSHD